jgi:hypothetical protein
VQLVLANCTAQGCAGAYFEVLDDELLPGVVLPLMPLVPPVVPEGEAPPVLSVLPVPLVPLEPGVLLLLLPGVDGVLPVAPGVLLLLPGAPAALLLPVPLEPPAVPVLPALLPPLELGVSVLLLALPLGGVLGVVLGVVEVLPALLLVSLASFFPHAPNARVATSAASNTECFIFIPLKKMYF